MKTKFILHGGMLKYDSPYNTSFFKEFTKDLQGGDKVLFIGFARRDLDSRQEVYERDKGFILAHTDKDVIVENAELETLVEQAKEAKAIFVTGGDTTGLQNDIASKPDFLEAIKGKVYAGSSAGAMITAKYKYACSDDEVQEGLGWLPIRLMVHYGNPEFSSTEETKKVIEKYDSSLELVLLPECEWQVKEIEL
ncbi:Type 1 glutamine amidotransferase-like domain-containing protein [Candidatus Pacebacteria bacterium]|nr:Type 1 glutamine amidotransferase-like domain-containing protein [Candidatus Paceibacterota bacterium]